jgi:hypothetical protein
MKNKGLKLFSNGLMRAGSQLFGYFRSLLADCLLMFDFFFKAEID